MKTKTFFLGLLTGTFFLMYNPSFAQYHSGGGGGGGGGGGDSPFTSGTNAFNLGVGFGSGINDILGSGYSSSPGPVILLSWEHGLSEHWGVGLQITDQSTTNSESSNYTELSGFTATGAPIYTTYTDSYSTKVSLLTFCARGAYHFSAGSKFDPYVGIFVGYCTASLTESVSIIGISTSATASTTAVEFGGFGGARYWFSNHIGAWAELQFGTASFSSSSTSASGTTTSSSHSINPCGIFNLGVALKF